MRYRISRHDVPIQGRRYLRLLADYSGEPVNIEKATLALESADTFIVAVKAFLAKPR